MSVLSLAWDALDSEARASYGLQIQRPAELTISRLTGTAARMAAIRAVAVQVRIRREHL